MLTKRILGTRKKGSWKVKAAGLTLTTLPTEHCLICDKVFFYTFFKTLRVTIILSGSLFNVRRGSGYKCDP